MDLEKDLQELLVTTKHPSECGVKGVFRKLNETEAKALEKAIDTPHIPVTRIANLLVQHDIRIGVDTIRRHRNRGKGGCSCL